MVTPDELPLLQSLQRRVVAVLGLRLTLRVLVAWALALGTVVVVTRAAFGLSPQAPLLVATVVLVLALACAWVLAFRRRPSADRLAAFVDDRQQLGGLLVAAGETDLGDWQRRLAALGTVTVHWRADRWWLLLVSAGLYLAAAMMVPMHGSWAARQQRALDVSREVEQLGGAIEVLEEVQAVEPETAAQLVETLQELAADTSADDPAEAYETLDRTAHEVAQLAAEAVERMLAEEQRLTEAEALTEALRSATGELSPSLAHDLRQTLAELTEQLQLDLAQELTEAGQTGTVPDELLAQLAQAQAENRADLVHRLGKLEEVRLIDQRLVSECKRCNSRSGKSSAEGLLAFLADNEGEAAAGQLLTSWCNRPGRGGLSRGRGDAAMTWSDGSERSGARFQEQVLPASQLSALRQSELVGLSATAPEADHQPVVLGSGALGTGPERGGSAVRRQLLPRHRQAVQRYFERSPSTGAADGQGTSSRGGT